MLIKGGTHTDKPQPCIDSISGTPLDGNHGNDVLIDLAIRLPRCTYSASESTCHSRRSDLAAAPMADRLDASASGLFDLWWMYNETNSTGGQPGFLFACGQIGGTGTARWDQCICDDPSNCQNCYRWWDATAIEGVASRGLWRGDRLHAEKARTLLAHSPYNANWGGMCAYIDDFSWYLLAYTRVYAWLREPPFLHAATALFDWVLAKGLDSDCGGVTWRACGKGEGCGCTKNSVTLLEVVIASARLARLQPANPRYLRTARTLWAWYHEYNLFDSHGASPG